MNFCKDCKHFNDLGNGISICIHPEAPRSPVYGNFSGTCDLMRSPNALIQPRCGPVGNWFEPIPNALED